MIEQEESAKFLPAFFVEPVALGQEFESGELPPHMTYFPPVYTSLEATHAQRLRTYINPMSPFMAEVGKPALLGPENTIPAKLMVHTEPLLAVHRKIVSVLQYLPHSTQYRTPYNPHITIREGDTAIETGDAIEVGGFSIVEKNPRRNTWLVVAKIGLKGADMITDAKIIKRNTEV